MGQKIAFLGFCNGYVPCRQISVASADGSNRRVITSSRDGVSNFSWSPREDRIAYVEQTLSGPTKVLIINSDGSGGREVAKVENADCHFTASSPRRQVSVTVTPTWSADGLALAFNTCFEGGTAIAIADKDVTKVRVLVKGGHSPVWSPDGEHLLYIHGPTASDPTVSICIVGVDGKDLRNIFSAHGTPSGLTRLRDGSTVAFVSMHGNKAEVFQINVDGTGLTMIGSARDEYFSLSSPMFSPDGKKLVMSLRQIVPVKLLSYASSSWHGRQVVHAHVRWLGADEEPMVNCDHRAIPVGHIISVGKVQSQSLDVARNVSDDSRVFGPFSQERSHVQPIGHERKQITRTTANPCRSTARLGARQTATAA